MPPSGQHQLFGAINIAHDRRRVVGKDALHRRQVTGAVLVDREQPADRILISRHRVEVAHGQLFRLGDVSNVGLGLGVYSRIEHHAATAPDLVVGHLRPKARIPERVFPFGRFLLPVHDREVRVGRVPCGFKRDLGFIQRL